MLFNWDDLRFFLACARHGGTSQAARALRVNQSTVSRRITALESSLDVALFERTGRGTQVTAAGERLLEKVTTMDQLAREAELAVVASRQRLEGVVRVTTVEDIANWQIAPGLPAFRKAFPGIEIQLLTTTRVLSLRQREADVALRLGEPVEAEVVARKVGGFGMGVYASKRYLAQIPRESWREAKALDWIMVDPVPQGYPWTDWLKRIMGEVKPVLRCNQYKTLVASIGAGLGVGLLPRPMAYFHRRLQRLPIDTQGLGQPIWLLVHKDLRQNAAVRVVMDFLVAMLNRPIKPTESEVVGSADTMAGEDGFLDHLIQRLQSQAAKPNGL